MVKSESNTATGLLGASISTVHPGQIPLMAIAKEPRSMDRLGFGAVLMVETSPAGTVVTSEDVRSLM
jgi:hypothetical protein